MKKIVYVRSSDIYNDSRAQKEISALLSDGYYVIIIGWERTQNAADLIGKCFCQFNNYSVLLYKNRKPDDGVFNKVVNRLKWGRFIKKQILSIDNIFAVHSCDFDTGFVVCKIAKKKKIPFIYDIFDYYSDGHSFNQFVSGIIEKFECKVINRSNVTIICSEERKEQIKNAKPSKLIVINNSPPINRIYNYREAEYDYVYCGSLSEGRLIPETINLYEDGNTYLKVLFAGYGVYSDEVREKSQKNDNFTFIGPIPYSRVLELESCAACLSAVYEPSRRNHRLCAPNKFYESLALGKPVIVCKGTGIDKIVEKYGIGTVINYDARELYKAIVYYKNNPDVCMEIHNKAQELYKAYYDWNMMKNRLLDSYHMLNEPVRDEN